MQAQARVAQLDRLIAAGDAASSGLLPTTGNRFALFTTSGSYVDRLVQDIAGAREQVDMSMYAFQPGEPGGAVERVAQALRERARAGVPVTVQLDEYGSGLVKQSQQEGAFIDSLRGAGVEVRIKPWRVRGGLLDDHVLAVDHRKLVEIDGRVSWQGGINLVDAWMPWTDMMLRTEGPAAAQGGALLAARWRDLGGTVSDRRREVLAAGLRAPVDDAAYAARQLSTGNKDRREIAEEFVRQADAATDRLWLMNPYWGDAGLIGSIESAARRGVDVRVLMPPAQGSHEDVLMQPLRKAFAARIMAAGGAVYELPAFAHAKAWLADGAATVGSFNFDRGSTARNYEVALTTDDPDVVRPLEAFFAAQQGSARLATAEDVHGWSRWRWLRDRLHLEI